jgi:two-component system, chemotaxis family, chemotaxis protein CheY
MGRVLLVDKSYTVSYSLKTVIEDSGYEVVMAHDGISALSMLMTANINLMLLESEIPFMTSLDLCMMIRHIPAHTSLPIILITSSLHAPVSLKAQALGIAVSVQKPVEPTSLLALIHHYLCDVRCNITTNL